MQQLMVQRPQGLKSCYNQLQQVPFHSKTVFNLTLLLAYRVLTICPSPFFWLLIAFWIQNWWHNWFSLSYLHHCFLSEAAGREQLHSFSPSLGWEILLLPGLSKLCQFPRTSSSSADGELLPYYLQQLHWDGTFSVHHLLLGQHIHYIQICITKGRSLSNLIILHYIISNDEKFTIGSESWRTYLMYMQPWTLVRLPPKLLRNISLWVWN